MQLPEGQTAMFRRQSQVVVSVAVRINHPSIIRDTILLNLSQLQPGPYQLEVGLGRKDGTSALGRRRIVIEP